MTAHGLCTRGIIIMQFAICNMHVQTSHTEEAAAHNIFRILNLQQGLILYFFSTTAAGVLLAFSSAIMQVYRR